jgi:y4mF family transcriptional regulator
MNSIVTFIKNSRKKHGLTQEELAFKAGVGLRFLRELERGKTTVQLDKVNIVLNMFGKELGITDKQPGNDQ